MATLEKTDIVVKGYIQLDESMIHCVLCDAYLAARNSITRVINVALYTARQLSSCVMLRTQCVGNIQS